MENRVKELRLQRESNRKVEIPVRSLVITTSFILALIGSYLSEGLFFAELAVSGVIVCALLWHKQLSDQMTPTADERASSSRS